ncbi:MAG: enoyl-CoA hydratase/isomerase family protein [Pseudomonadota bacterium]
MSIQEDPTEAASKADAYQLVTEQAYAVFRLEDVPTDSGWLYAQPVPVIAVGTGDCENADIVVGEDQLETVQSAISETPLAASVLMQVLRAVERLPLQSAMSVESLAYATLQGGAEHQAWLSAQTEAPELIAGADDQSEPIIIEREDNILRAKLNRPEHRNSISVEMRDALVELFELVQLDTSIERLELSGEGACFSTGGELREFGLATDPAIAHQIRALHNPGRLLSEIAPRVQCHLHSACVGSGIEIPSFAGRMIADPKTYMQLPELKLGLIPGAGGCVSISRRIGRQRTAWLATTGKRINAKTALEWGLIDEIVDKDDR